MKRFLSLVALCLGVTASAEASPVVVASTDAAALAAAIGGAGITITNPTVTLATGTAAGTFTGGASSVGFDTGIVLTTGIVSCIPGPNNSDSCTGNGGGSFDTTELAFDFTSDTSEVFFSYVFGSEEYNEFVDGGFNDQFELLLNGTNIALVPGGGGVVSIDNVNCVDNAGVYRNNDEDPEDNCPSLGIDIQYDGLTTVLVATGTVVPDADNTFVFRIFDRGDNNLDSGVFIQAGSFSSEPPGTDPPTEPPVVPEPASMLLVGTGLAGAAVRRWRQRKA